MLATSLCKLGAFEMKLKSVQIRTKVIRFELDSEEVKVKFSPMKIHYDHLSQRTNAVFEVL